MDSYTSVTRQGYFSRIGNAIKGVIVGFILFIIAFPLLFWNEGRAVHRAQALEEGGKAVVTVDPTAVSPGNEGKLVHFTGTAVGTSLADPLLGVKQDAIHLQRLVEMYQWKEKKETETKKDTVGGGSTTTTRYTYSKDWSDKLEDSGKFDHPQDHRNPTSMRISGHTWDADPVKVAAFTIPSFLTADINNYTAIPLTQDSLTQISDSDVKADAILDDQHFVISGTKGDKPDAADPRVGDLRVTLKAVSSGPVSVIARQTGSTVDKYTTSKGEPLSILHLGTHSAAEMFAAEQSANATLTWILRFVGFIVMMIGIYLIFAPFKVLADVVGILGDIVGMGVGLAAFLISLALSMLTISIAWLFYRPLLGIGLLSVAVIGFVLFIISSRRARAARALRQPVPAVPT